MELDIKTPSSIYQAAQGALKSIKLKYYRNGIELEKGAIISEKRINKYRKLYEQYCSFWSTYPDLFLQLIARKDKHFKLFFYQSLFLRLTMRYGRLFVIAPRA